MNERLRLPFLDILDSVTNAKSSRLVVCAVGAGDELSERVVAWEPCFEVILHGCSIVERAGDNFDDLVWQFEALIEALRSRNHLFKLVPRLIWCTINELLHLLELVDSKNAPYIFAVRSSLLTEAGRATSISEWKILWFNPLATMHSRNWLLRCGD